MSRSEELIAAAYLVGFAAPAVVVAVRIAKRWSDDPLDRWFLGALLAIAQGVGVPLLASILGILNRNTVLVGHLVLAAIVVRFVERVPSGEPGPPRRASVGTLIALASGTAFAALSVAKALAGQSFDFDSRNYHLPHMADWIQSHSLWVVPFQAPGAWVSAHPSNGEFLGLWLALPVHGDQLSLLAPVLFGILGILGAAFLARELGGEAWLGGAGGVAVFLAPILYASQTRSLGTDNAATAGIVAAAALLARAVKSDAPRWGVAAGIALGLGMGSKYTALVPGAALAVAALVLLRPSRRWLMVLPGVVLFFGPWLVRNGIEFDNPLFPRPITIGGTEIFKGSDSQTLLLSRTLLDQIVHGKVTVVGRWIKDVSTQIGPAALLVVVGILAGLRRKASKLARIMSALTLVSVIAFLITPFTGGGPSGNDPTLIFSIRYFMLCPLLGAGIAASLGPRSRQLVAALVVAGLGYDAARIVGGSKFTRNVGLTVSPALVAFVVLVSGAVALVAWIERRPTVRVRSGGLTAAAALVVLAGGWGASAAVLHQENADYVPRPLERLVQRARGSHRVVELIGVKDLRSVVGRDLEVDLVAPPIPSGATHAMPGLIDASLRSTSVDVLVVSALRAIGVPRGYVPPPNWCLFGRIGTESVYLRVPGPGVPGARAAACG